MILYCKVSLNKALIRKDEKDKKKLHVIKTLSLRI